MNLPSFNREWRPVVGWEGLYAVSNHGEVRSVAGRQGARRGHILKLIPHRGYKTYARVNLCRNGKAVMKKVHHLVLEAFKGPRPEGEVGHHINGDTFDNRAENLEWCTYSMNTKDALLTKKETDWAEKEGKE